MTERHFRVVQLDGKKVEFGGVSITSKASPGSAARKLLTSIAHEKGLKKNKKASMSKVKFCIQEYTQGSSKKVYGPYVGHFHKYTAAELKKAKTAKGKIKFTMKPVVKLAKGNMKGGGAVIYKIIKICYRQNQGYFYVAKNTANQRNSNKLIEYKDLVDDLKVDNNNYLRINDLISQVKVQTGRFSSENKYQLVYGSGIKKKYKLEYKQLITFNINSKEEDRREEDRRPIEKLQLNDNKKKNLTRNIPNQPGIYPTFELESELKGWKLQNVKKTTYN